MNEALIPNLSLEVFEPQPGGRYTLEMTVRLTGVSRRAILVYCKSGLVEPWVDPPYGILYFDDQMIRAIRWIDYLRGQNVNLPGIRIIFELTAQNEKLRQELRFLRGW